MKLTVTNKEIDTEYNIDEIENLKIYNGYGKNIY